MITIILFFYFIILVIFLLNFKIWYLLFFFCGCLALLFSNFWGVGFYGPILSKFRIKIFNKDFGAWWLFLLCFIILNLFVFLTNNINLFQWIEIDLFSVNVSIEMTYKWEQIIFFIITFVSTMVILYSITYMHFSLDKNIFFIYIFLFWFSMLLIVVSGDLFILLIGWEGVGIISYLLINYWNLRIESNKSAIKALLLNKIGDFSLVFAGISFFNLFLSSTNLIINHLAVFFKNELYFFSGLSVNFFFLPLLLIVLAAISKSAQLIFCMWLPDAMEGPTPVSALIHSSTMVAAGYILLINYYKLIQIYEKFSFLIYILGLLTNWLSTLILLTTSDIKNTLANSTTAQIAYMITLVGANFPISSIVQFVAHAFYKSLAFLSFGSLIFQVKDNQEVRNISILNIQNPLMIFCLMISLLSFLGIPNCISHFGKLDLFSVVLAFNYSHNGFVFILLYSQIINFLGGIGLFLICIFYKNNIKINKNLIFNKFNWENSHILAILAKIILAFCSLTLGGFIYNISLFLNFLSIKNFNKFGIDGIWNQLNFPTYMLFFIITILGIIFLGEINIQNNYNYSQNSSITNWYLDNNLIKIVVLNFNLASRLTLKFCNICVHPAHYLKFLYL